MESKRSAELLSFQIEDVAVSERKSNTQRQYYAAICMSLLAFAYGSTSGWTSSAMIVLSGDDTPLDSGPLTTENKGWIASGIGIGGFFANLFFGWVIDIEQIIISRVI